MKDIKTILIVEDDTISRELEGALFKKAGYIIFEAEDAKKGRAIATDKTPDLIILDYQLPGTSGIQLLDDLRHNPKTKSIPCIFVTASVTAEQIEMFKSSKACGYITKPINTRTFVDQVLELARNCRQRETQ